MKRFILKRILANSFTKVIAKQNQTVIQGKKSYKLDLKDSTLKVETLALDYETGERNLVESNLFQVTYAYSLGSIEEKILNFIELFPSFVVTRIDQHRMTVMINSSTFTFTEKCIYFGNESVDLNSTQYIQKMSEYLFNRPLTEKEHEKLNKQLPASFVTERFHDLSTLTLDESFFKAPKFVTTIEQLLIHQVLRTTSINEPLQFVPTYDCYPLIDFSEVTSEFIGNMSYYSTVKREQIEEVIRELANSPKLQNMRRQVASYIRENESRLPEEAQLAHQIDRDYVLALAQNEIVNKQRLFKQQQVERRQQEKLLHNEQLYLQQCQELVNAEPYKEYIVEYDTTYDLYKVSDGKKITFTIYKLNFEQPIQDVTAHKQCVVGSKWSSYIRIQHHELFMRIFAGQDVSAYVLPRKDPFVPGREPNLLFVQTAENEQRRREVFAQYQQQQDEKLSQYKQQLLKEATEPFETTAYIQHFCSREEIYRFNLTTVFVQVEKNSAGTIEILLDDGTVLSTINHDRHRAVNVALDEGILLYGVIDNLYEDLSPYGYIYITNDYELFEQHINKLELNRQQRYCQVQNKLSIVGLKYHKGHATVGDKCTLRLDENNQYDPFAVAVYDPQGKQLGYIGRADSKSIAMLLQYHRNRRNNFYEFTITRNTYLDSMFGKLTIQLENT